MADIPRAEIFSFEVDKSDLATLTYCVHGAKVRVALSPRQVELLEMMLPRVRRSMSPPQTEPIQPSD